jgi:hypothetical protein
MSIHPSRSPQDEKCIFCLQETPTPSIYQGKCNCHPFIHEMCIHDWYSIHTEACPICLKSTVNHSDIITVISSPRYRDRDRDRYRYRLHILDIPNCCCIYVSCICMYSIPSILVILFSIYFLANIHIPSKDTINSTAITNITTITR